MFVTRGFPEPDTIQTSVLVAVIEKLMRLMVMVEKMLAMVEKMIVTQGVERRLGREGVVGTGRREGGHAEEGLCD